MCSITIHITWNEWFRYADGSFKSRLFFFYMNQKARAMLQYNAYLCIFTWAVNWFVFLEWIAEKGFVIFFTVSEIEFIVDGTVISPMLSSPFCDRLLFFASRCSDLNSRRDSFLYGASFFYIISFTPSNRPWQ